MRRMAMLNQGSEVGIRENRSWDSGSYNFLVATVAPLGGSVQIGAALLAGVVHDAALRVVNALGKFVLVLSLAENIFQGALLFEPQAEQVVVHQLHTELHAGLNRTVDAERLVF